MDGMLSQEEINALFSGMGLEDEPATDTSTSTAYDDVLTPEEKDEMKQYQKLADGYTPLLKLMSSEYSNSLAYDSLQIHGGSGFMKDYPIERIYRDARITTIYEGTSQLQVVAAIKGVTTGLFAAQMAEYEKNAPKAEMQHLMDTLIQMREQYQQAVEAVQALKQGKIDAVIIDDQPAQTFVKETEGLKILETEYAVEDYAAAISKENTELTENLNKALK